MSGATLAGLALAAAVASFDHTHGTWGALLARHVVGESNGSASRVDYDGFDADRVRLNDYLTGLSAVSAGEFETWGQAHRLAFLLNAYNAFTVALVLDHRPGIDSIRDIGGLFRSPWRVEFVPLLGATVSLDHIEHTLVRGRFAEPRIHFALNCASIGCPALRAEAFVADALEAQLESATRAFLADRARNGLAADARVLRVSPIFDWYRGDFERAAGSLAAYLARYADVLADAGAGREAIAAARVRVAFGRYDWRLNSLDE